MVGKIRFSSIGKYIGENVTVTDLTGQEHSGRLTYQNGFFVERSQRKGRYSPTEGDEIKVRERSLTIV